MMALCIKVAVQPENRMELQQTLRTLKEAIRQEAGCLDVSIFLNLLDESNLIIEEEWGSQQELENHLRSENFAVLYGAITCLSATGKSSVRILSENEDFGAIHNLRKKMTASSLQ